MRTSPAHFLVFLVTSAVVMACAPSAATSTRPSSAPSAPPAVSASPARSTSSLSPGSTAAPSLPPGVSAWPASFDVAFAGTYWSSPPFRVPFSITVDEPGWFSGHLHAEFVDLQRFDGTAQHQFPNRMIGFGDPDHVRGGDGDIAVAGLTPDAALDRIAERASLRTTNRAAQSLLGVAGARADIHSATSNNPLFGGADGDFGLGPQLDVRLVLLPLDGRLLVVAVLAAPGDLDGAWEQALPILETVRLA